MIKLGQMVLKGVNLVHNDKIRSYGLERCNLDIQCRNQLIWSGMESIGYTIQKSGHMVLKAVNCIHNIKSGHMVLKAVNCIHNDKIRSNGLERSQFGYTMQKSGHMVLKGVNWVHNDKLGQVVLKGSTG